MYFGSRAGIVSFALSIPLNVEDSCLSSVKKRKRKIADAREFLQVLTVLTTITSVEIGERKHLKESTNPYV